MDTKHITTRATFKAGEEDTGRLEAVFSTFGVVDRDGDIVEPGAIPDGQDVAMVWSHDWTRMIGKGVTRTDAERAVFDGGLFMDTDAGLDAYKTIKSMGDLMEYSWGFRILDADFVERDEEYIRVIKRVELFEVSPVLIGAGRGTQTLSLKHGQPLVEHADALDDAVRDFVSRVRGRVEYRAKEGRTLSTANRERLSAIADALAGALGDLNAILKETEPAKGIDPDVLRAVIDAQLTDARLNGVLH